MQQVTQSFAQRMRDELDIEVRTDYSGRFMWGRSCLGIVGGPDSLMQFAFNLKRWLVEAANEDDDVDPDDITVPYEWEKVRWDNMGSDMIFYWPEVEVVDDPDEPDPDADFGGRADPVDFSDVNLIPIPER